MDVVERLIDHLGRLTNKLLYRFHGCNGIDRFPSYPRNRSPKISMKPQLKINLVFHADGRNQGFATVVALGLGLSLTLIGVMMITRSQGDVSTVTSQRAISKSFAAAETGIVRFQTLIDRNREIAILPACGNASLSNTTPCSDATNPSWFVPPLPTPDVTAAATRAWKNIDPANPNRGQYRLIDYTYDVTTQVGTLIVEGRVEQNTGRGASTTRLAVTIPISTTAVGGAVSGVPGLWAQSFYMGNPAVQINANILDSSQVIGGKTFAASNNAPDDYLGKIPILPLPNTPPPYDRTTTVPIVTPFNVPFPPLPGVTYAGQVASIPAANMNNKPCIQITTETPELNYPVDGDVFTDAAGTVGTYHTTDAATAPSMSGNYAYRFPNGCGGSMSFNQTSSVIFGKSVNQTFSLFLDGNLTMANTGTIKPFPLNTNPTASDSAALIIYINGDVNLNNSAGLSPPEKFQLYIYGVRNMTTANVGNFRGFIFAPESTVTSNNTGAFIGAVWTKNFSSSLGSVYQSDLDATKLKVTVPTTGSKPRMGNISSWTPQQVN